jgi:hypothetical protein
MASSAGPSSGGGPARISSLSLRCVAPPRVDLQTPSAAESLRSFFSEACGTDFPWLEVSVRRSGGAVGKGRLQPWDVKFKLISSGPMAARLEQCLVGAARAFGGLPLPAFAPCPLFLSLPDLQILSIRPATGAYGVQHSFQGLDPRAWAGLLYAAVPSGSRFRADWVGIASEDGQRIVGRIATLPGGEEGPSPPLPDLLLSDIGVSVCPGTVLCLAAHVPPAFANHCWQLDLTGLGTCAYDVRRLALCPSVGNFRGVAAASAATAPEAPAPPGYTHGVTNPLFRDSHALVSPLAFHNPAPPDLATLRSPYMEAQEGDHCAVHSLNATLGYPACTPTQMQDYRAHLASLKRVGADSAYQGVLPSHTAHDPRGFFAATVIEHWLRDHHNVVAHPVGRCPAISGTTGVAALIATVHSALAGHAAGANAFLVATHIPEGRHLIALRCIPSGDRDEWFILDSNAGHQSLWRQRTPLS